MSHRFADSNKYNKPFIRSLPAAYKILWELLCLECDHAGIWQVDFEIAQIKVGKDAPINAADAVRHFNAGEKRVYGVNGGKKWFIPSFITFQYRELKPAHKVHASVIKRLTEEGIDWKTLLPVHDDGTLPICDLPTEPPLPAQFETQAPAQSAKAELKRFAKPTIEEVQEYCKERGGIVDAQRWYNHYSSNGWRVGKNPMKDWRAAVRTWERSEYGTKKSSAGAAAPVAGKYDSFK